MANRTSGVTIPCSTDQLAKSTAATATARPATTENSFTPTSCSQSIWRSTAGSWKGGRAAGIGGEGTSAAGPEASCPGAGSGAAAAGVEGRGGGGGAAGEMAPAEVGGGG